jgi:hypothetical protein
MVVVNLGAGTQGSRSGSMTAGAVDETVAVLRDDGRWRAEPVET